MVSRVDIAKELERCERLAMRRSFGRMIQSIVIAFVSVFGWELAQFVAGAGGAPLELYKSMASASDERNAIRAELIHLEQVIAVKSGEGQARIECIKSLASLPGWSGESG